MRSLVIGLGLILLVAVSAAAGKAERKKELTALRQEVRYVDLRAREDLRAAGPAPGAGAVIELEDGSVYFQEDAGLVFEKLGPIRVEKLVLRGGHRLLVRLYPPSDLRPRIIRHVGEGWSGGSTSGRVADTGPARGRRLVTSLDLDEYVSMREALSMLVYLPGESPSAEELAACLARYPDHEEPTSELRCGAGE